LSGFAGWGFGFLSPFLCALFRFCAGLGLLWIVAGRPRGKTAGIEEAKHTVGGLCADREPMFHTVLDKRDAAVMILRQERVVSTELLDEAAVAGRCGFRNDDPVIRAFFGTAPCEPDFQWHVLVSLLNAMERRKFKVPNCIS